ncbi:hypothetical protein LY76DRAFT_599057 [Colletotrichum caudatum]|nr:hypothetical protein LY76DRAFT_599057 [Colletotrichum caudatum]
MTPVPSGFDQGQSFSHPIPSHLTHSSSLDEAPSRARAPDSKCLVPPSPHISKSIAIASRPLHNPTQAQVKTQSQPQNQPVADAVVEKEKKSRRKTPVRWPSIWAVCL